MAENLTSRHNNYYISFDAKIMFTQKNIFYALQE